MHFKDRQCIVYVRCRMLVTDVLKFLKMGDFETRVRKWRESLGMSGPDEETMRSLCHPQIRPIIEDMMRTIRPAAEIQMIRRTLALHEAKKKLNSQEPNSKDENIVKLHTTYKELKKVVEEKRAKIAQKKKKIESLKIKVQQKHRKASTLEREINELRKLTIMVTSESQQLNMMKSKLESNTTVCVAVDHKNTVQEQQPLPSEASCIVSKFTKQQEAIISELKSCRVSEPPQPVEEVGWHLEHVKVLAENVKLKKQLETYKSELEVAVESLVQSEMYGSSDSKKEEMVREWAKLHVTKKANEVLQTCLKDVVSVRKHSVHCDRDYLRLLLLEAEKKLCALDERFKGAVNELLKEADYLSASWQRIEKAAEKARSKRSQLDVAVKEAQISLPELTQNFRLAVAEELNALHATMLSLTTGNDTAQQGLDFGTAHNNLTCILNLVAEKRMAKHVILSLPKMLTFSDDQRLKYLISTISNQSSGCEGEKNTSKICEYICKHERLLQSSRDLKALWWQPQQFEEAVPEELVVMEKNMLQHAASWDRIAAFLEQKNK